MSDDTADLVREARGYATYCKASGLGDAHALLLRLVDALEAANGWLPIETAPKETLVLIWNDGWIHSGYLDGEGRWRNRPHGVFVRVPLRWMPVPPPPEPPK